MVAIAISVYKLSCRVGNGASEWWHWTVDKRGSRGFNSHAQDLVLPVMGQAKCWASRHMHVWWWGRTVRGQGSASKGHDGYMRSCWLAWHSPCFLGNAGSYDKGNWSHIPLHVSQCLHDFSDVWSHSSLEKKSMREGTLSLGKDVIFPMTCLLNKWINEWGREFYLLR